MGGSDLRKTNAPGACLLRKGDPFSRRLRDRLILTTPPAPNGVLITRLVFFLLNLLKQFSESLFSGSMSSVIRPNPPSVDLAPNGILRRYIPHLKSLSLPSPSRRTRTNKPRFLVWWRMTRFNRRWRLHPVNFSQCLDTCREINSPDRMARHACFKSRTQVRPKTPELAREMLARVGG